MEVGDRVVLQKNIKNIKGGSICTITDVLKENNFMIRFNNHYIGVHKEALRLASKKEIDDFIVDNFVLNKVVNPRLRIGSVYVVSTIAKIDTLKNGDLGFVFGLNVSENEKNDIVIFDFGTEKRKFDKKFVDEHMFLLEQIKDELKIVNEEEIDDFEQLIEEIENDKEEENISDNIGENKNKTMQQNKEVIKINDFTFVLNDGKIEINEVFNVENIENYIKSLNNLKKIIQ